MDPDLANPFFLIVYLILVVAPPLRSLKRALTKNRRTFLTAGPQTMYQ